MTLIQHSCSQMFIKPINKTIYLHDMMSLPVLFLVYAANGIFSTESLKKKMGVEYRMRYCDVSTFEGSHSSAVIARLRCFPWFTSISSALLRG